MQPESDELGSKQLEACLNGEISLHVAVNLFARAILTAAHKSNEGNLAATARSLGVKRTSLTEMMQRRGNFWRISTHGKYYRHKKVPQDFICPECLSVLASSSCSMCEGLQVILAHSIDLPCKSKSDN
jgi:hypothetical protein